MIGIYIRQSIEKKDSISLESQANLCKTLADGEFKIYSDSGFSGKNTERPKLKELIADIDKGIIKKVIVYKLDRISRSILDFNNLLELFKKYDVDFVSYSENIDTKSPMGRAMVNIIATFAQLEREQIAERIRANYYARGEQGRFLGGTIPFGFNRIYTVIDNKKAPMLEANEDAKIIIDIFNLYAYSNKSLGDIMRYLNDKGIKSANGKTWDNNKISRILRNVIYCKCDAEIYKYYQAKGVEVTNPIDDFNGLNACFLYGKREANQRRYTNVENHKLTVALHSGIIDSHTFLICQYKLDNNKQIKNSGKSKVTFLSNIKCATCGYSVSVQKNRSNKRYLVCRGRHIGACDGFKSLLADELEEAVAIEINKKLKELSDVKLNTQNDAEANKVKAEIIKIDAEIENLLSKIAEANPIVMKYINDKISELDSRKKQLEIDLQKQTINTFDDLEELFLGTDFNELSFEQKRELVLTLISKIEVNNEKAIIKFKV